MLTTESIIKALVEKYRADDADPRLANRALIAPEKKKFVSLPMRSMHVRQSSECVIVLPNGHKVHVMTDASRVATQIEEDDSMHAIVRPNAIRTGTRFYS